MSAVVEADGSLRQLDRRPQPDENINQLTVKDPVMLAKYLLRLFRDVSALKRRWAPNRMDFKGIVGTGSAVSPQTVYLDHNFGGPVVWWLVDITDLGTGSLKPIEKDATATTDNRLTLTVMFEGTFTVRVEEAG